MFKNGTKFLLGLAAFGFVGAVWYGFGTGPHGAHHTKIWFITLPPMDSIVGVLTLGYKGHVGDHAGYVVLMGLAVVALAVGVLFAAIHDADPEAVAQVAGTEALPEVPTPVRASYWPIVGAFSLALLAVGLAFDKAYALLGIAGLVATTFEWAIRTWADRATGDPEVNQTIRDRFIGPVEVPIAAVLGIALVVVPVSRILLALPKGGSYVVFGVVPVLILGFGVLVALRPKLSRSVIAGLLVAFAVVILAGGIVAGIHGARKAEEKGGEESARLHAPASLQIRAGR